MFTKTDSQLSLFDVKNVFPDALPKDDWSYIYRDGIYSLIDEEGKQLGSSFNLAIRLCKR